MQLLPSPGLAPGCPNPARVAVELNTSNCSWMGVGMEDTPGSSQ